MNSMIDGDWSYNRSAEACECRCRAERAAPIGPDREELRAAWPDAGRISREGDPAEVAQAYLDEPTAQTNG